MMSIETGLLASAWDHLPEAHDVTLLSVTLTLLLIGLLFLCDLQS